MFEVSADVGVQHDEFELNIVGLVGHPFAVHSLFDYNGEVDIEKTVIIK